MTSTDADARDARATAQCHGNVGDTALGTFLSRATAWILTAGGALGTAAAFALILDRISLLKDPDFVPSCSISPLLSCGSVMTSPQAEVLGFPNPLIGLVAFPIVTTVGVVTLVGGTVPRSVWLGLQLGTAAGLFFVHWLIGQSLYSIGALCPYCMIVWVVTITMFWYVTVHNLTAGHLLIRARWQQAAAHIARYHSAILSLWFLVIVALIAVRFWPYWVGLVS
ncbi:vitamin K epoxide reductase family protein [Pseudonocardia sp. CA-142604]|uniref:vitamin K epoxide reductase family protein n=1 Tax=Pseudonocardia sp. CA-142604 TaxID=3240024 RepID=UPI003D8FFC33